MFLDAVYSNIVIPAMATAESAMALWNAKAAERLASLRDPQPIPQRDGRPRLWVHAASMGEFEQLIPILLLLKGAVHVVATFFSPSGAAHGLRRHDVVDVVRMLPLDGRQTMRRFVHEINADAVLIGRYDVWRNMILALNAASTPILLANATYPSAASRVQGWVADTYRRLTDIVAVTDADAQAISELTGRPVTSMADSRYDRIMDTVTAVRSQQPVLPPVDVPTIVVGSSWDADVNCVFQAAKRFGLHRLRLIIVPHEPTPEHIRHVEQQLLCKRLSTLPDGHQGHIVVDTVGALLSLYSIADLAFIGGGFGVGVHSLAEPSGFGIPCACGPNIRKSREGMELAYAGGIRIVPSADACYDWLSTMVSDTVERRRVGDINRSYLAQRTGSARALAERVMALLPL
jgi:3-deoxy-D-manno-octulosonic-acid transferase